VWVGLGLSLVGQVVVNTEWWWNGTVHNIPCIHCMPTGSQHLVGMGEGVCLVLLRVYSYVV